MRKIKIKITLFHRTPGQKNWTRNSQDKPVSMAEARVICNDIKTNYKLDVKIVETITIENEEII